MLLALARTLLACTDYKFAEVGVVDSFVQTGVDQQSDVLLVIDDSASMAEEQARLLGSFEALLDTLETTRADFQIAVTTTDVEAGSTFSSVVLDPDLEELGEAFLAAVAVGSEGGRVEQGLHQALLSVNPAINPGFLREGADLHVLVVSDEDDQSEYEVDFYLHELQALVGEERVVVHAIVGDLPMGCVSGTSAADAGPRYLEASSATGGISGSICAEDYSPLLERVGLLAAAWNDRFPLSRIPQLDTLEVTVDGVGIPAREADGWTWSAGDNELVFTGRAIPRPGMSIEARYQPQMGAEAGTPTAE